MEERSMVILEFDGLFRGMEGGANSPDLCGFMCYGWLIRRSGRIIARGYGTYMRCSDATSNVAEYLALIEGLEALRDMSLEKEPILVIGDAKTVINQMEGFSNTRAVRIRKLNHRALRIARYFRDIRFLWVPRRENHAADQLSRRALKQLKFDPGAYRMAMRHLDRERRKGKSSPRLLPVHDLRIIQPRVLQI